MDRREALSYRIGASAAAVAWGLLMWLFWQVALEGAFYMDPRLSIAWMAGVMVVFLRVYAWGARSRRVRARLRVRSPGRAWKWIAALAPGLPAMLLGLWAALLALGLARDEPLPEIIQKFTERPYGELAFWVLALAAAPLIEEFAFRGWIQRPLERRIGPQAAIALTATLFSAAHMQADGFPVRLAAGLVIGHAVYASRSLWTGVALHAAWNGTVLALSVAAPDLDPTGKGWTWAAPAVALALVSLVWCAWAVRRMQDEVERPAGRGRQATAGHPVESS